MKKFKNSTTLFEKKPVFEHGKIWRAKFEKGILPELKWIDIACEEERTEVIFKSYEKINSEDFYDFLKRIGAGESFRKDAPLVFVKELQYPSQEENLYSYLTELFQKLEAHEPTEILSQ